MEETIRHVVQTFAALTIPAMLYVGIRWSNIKLKRLEGAAAEERGELDERLAGRVAELEQQVLELQERVDFAERLLSRGRDAGEPVR